MIPPKAVARAAKEQGGWIAVLVLLLVQWIADKPWREDDAALLARMRIQHEWIRADLADMKARQDAILQRLMDEHATD